MRGSGILTVIHKGPNNIAEIERATEKMKTWRHTVGVYMLEYIEAHIEAHV